MLRSNDPTPHHDSFLTTHEFCLAEQISWQRKPKHEVEQCREAVDDPLYLLPARFHDDQSMELSVGEWISLVVAEIVIQRYQDVSLAAAIVELKLIGTSAVVLFRSA
jgi:hypothetical protein